MAAYLAAHDGVIDVAHAHAFGLSNGDIRGRLARGEWFAVARGVYRSAARPYTESALVRAAILAYRGVADRTTAAWWHGMVKDLPGAITLSTPHRQRSPHWPVQVVATRRRFRPETLPSGAQFLDRMLQTRVVSLDELTRAVEDNAGTTGMVAARSLLAVAASDSESAAERLFVRLLDNWGVSGWVQQHPIGGRWRLDFAWPEIRMGVEISGWAYHRDNRRHRNDLAKANWLERHEWSELQYNWHMLSDSPEECIQEVVDMINARSIAPSR